MLILWISDLPDFHITDLWFLSLLLCVLVHPAFFVPFISDYSDLDSYILVILIFLLLIMDETVIRRLSNVGLHEDKSLCLQLDDRDIDEGLKEDVLNVLVHIHGGKSNNFEGFKTAMGEAWRCGSFSIQQFDDLFYQIYFGI